MPGGKCRTSAHLGLLRGPKESIGAPAAEIECADPGPQPEFAATSHPGLLRLGARPLHGRWSCHEAWCNHTSTATVCQPVVREGFPRLASLGLARANASAG